MCPREISFALGIHRSHSRTLQLSNNSLASGVKTPEDRTSRLPTAHSPQPNNNRQSSPLTSISIPVPKVIQPDRIEVSEAECQTDSVQFRESAVQATVEVSSAYAQTTTESDSPAPLQDQNQVELLEVLAERIEKRLAQFSEDAQQLLLRQQPHEQTQDTSIRDSLASIQSRLGDLAQTMSSQSIINAGIPQSRSDHDESVQNERLLMAMVSDIRRVLAETISQESSRLELAASNLAKDQRSALEKDLDEIRSWIATTSDNLEGRLGSAIKSVHQTILANSSSRDSEGMAIQEVKALLEEQFRILEDRQRTLDELERERQAKFAEVRFRVSVTNHSVEESPSCAKDGGGKQGSGGRFARG